MTLKLRLRDGAISDLRKYSYPVWGWSAPGCEVRDIPPFHYGLPAIWIFGSGCRSQEWFSLNCARPHAIRQFGMQAAEGQKLLHGAAAARKVLTANTTASGSAGRPSWQKPRRKGRGARAHAGAGACGEGQSWNSAPTRRTAAQVPFLRALKW